MSKSYNREDKIKYYTTKIYDLKNKLEYAEKRLKYLLSDEYQDWNSSLNEEIRKLRDKKS